MKIRKVLKVLLFAAALELLWFNRGSLIMQILPDIERDVVYSLNDVTLINYSANEAGEWISGNDSQVHLASVDFNVQKLEVTYQTTPVQDECTVYYTNLAGEVLAVSGQTNSTGMVSATIDAAPGTVLRLDIGETEGIQLSELTVTLNPTSLHISISRIMAVLLIYISGVLLFGLQKMPDYSQYVVAEKDKKN